MKVNHLSGEAEPWPLDKNIRGYCYTVPKVDGNVIAVVVPKGQKEALFTIIHESVHVWQSMMTYIEEESPGIETEAYTIEHICSTLMKQYEKLTGEKIAVHDQRETRLQKGKPAVQQSSGSNQEAG